MEKFFTGFFEDILLTSEILLSPNRSIFARGDTPTRARCTCIDAPTRDRVEREIGTHMLIFTSDEAHAIFAAGGSGHRWRYILQARSSRISRLLFLRARTLYGRRLSRGNKFHTTTSRSPFPRRAVERGKEREREVSLGFIIHPVRLYPTKRRKIVFPRNGSLYAHILQTPKNSPGKGIARALIRLCLSKCVETRILSR